MAASSRRRGSTRLTADIVRLAEGVVHVTSLGPVPVKGVAVACGGLRAARRGRAARHACRPAARSICAATAATSAAGDTYRATRSRSPPSSAWSRMRAVCRVALAG